MRLKEQQRQQDKDHICVLFEFINPYWMLENTSLFWIED